MNALSIIAYNSRVAACDGEVKILDFSRKSLRKYLAFLGLTKLPTSDIDTGVNVDADVCSGGLGP
jgi:hypothetical protein